MPRRHELCAVAEEDKDGIIGCCHRATEWFSRARSIEWQFMPFRAKVELAFSQIWWMFIVLHSAMRGQLVLSVKIEISMR